MPVDDLDLDRDGVAPPPFPPSPHSAWHPWLVGAAVALAVTAGGLVRWWTLRPPAEPSPAAAPASATDVPRASSPMLPPLSEMDAFLRTLLGALSSRPQAAAWLATDGLIYQMAAIIDRVSRGGTPAADLRVVAPTGAFTTERRGRRRVMSAASERRYDALAEALASVDPARVAAAYHTIQPRLDEAYRALGRSESTVDVAVRQALDLLVATPVPGGPVELVEGPGATWAFADPSLEALAPAQKQLLRMGPANAARVIETLTQVRRQLQP